MSQLRDDRPHAMIAEVWQQYRSWAKTSRSLKSRQGATKVWVFGLGVVGAALGTIAGQESWFTVESAAAGGEDVTSAIPRYLAVASAVAIALAGYLGRELLTPSQEDTTTRARFLAEALKRLTWLAIMRVPPYDGRDAHLTLEAQAEQLVKNTGLIHSTGAAAAAREETPPEAGSVDQYIELRVLDQATWYTKAADQHQRRLGRFRNSSLVLGGITIVLGLAGIRDLGFSVWVPFVTTAAGALVALYGAARVQEIIALYQGAATQLRLQVARWRDGEARRREMRERGEDEAVRRLGWEFVVACEEIMSQENQAWRAQWSRGEDDRGGEDAADGGGDRAST